MSQPPSLILGIETSCDETAVALVTRDDRVLASVIASQTDIHAPYGGVVPELASRAHVEKLLPLLEEAWAQAHMASAPVDAHSDIKNTTARSRTGGKADKKQKDAVSSHDHTPSWDDIAAIAATFGPGLAGCLLVGIESAKGLALARNKPLVGVNHLVGHLWSVFLRDPEGNPLASLTRDGQPVNPGDFVPPYVGLVVSGGHSTLALVEGPQTIETLGQTLDDAAGEAYDKVAKLLGLGYPGGPVIDRLAREWTPRPGEEDWPLPRPLKGKAGLEFSFSGLKTAVVRMVEKRGGPEAVAGDPQQLRGLCAAFQERVIGLLVDRALLAMEQRGIRRLAVVGGVACNRGLRQAIGERLAGKGVVVAIPPPSLCTDNAAMIAAVGRQLWERGFLSDLDLNAEPSLPLPVG